MKPEERETVQMEVTKEAMEALIALLTKRDKRIAELEDALANKAAEKMPHSFVRMKWACGHEGSAVCEVCFKEKCVSIAEWEEWADRIANDDRVTGWVHAHDYSLYLLLADCPIERLKPKEEQKP